MRKVSQKRRQLLASVRELRDSYVRSRPKCERFGCLHSPVLCHEIARGIYRNDALDELSCILALCWTCHAVEVHGNGVPIVTQLRWKLESQRRYGDNGFCLETFNRIRGRAKGAITLDEIEAVIL